MRIYVSGPIKGHEDTYVDAFAKETEKLRKEGFEVVSPVELGQVLEYCLGVRPTYEEYMLDDLNQLLRCDQIHMLSGWEYSTGARCEFHVAVLCGLKVTYQ